MGTQGVLAASGDGEGSELLLLRQGQRIATLPWCAAQTGSPWGKAALAALPNLPGLGAAPGAEPWLRSLRRRKDQIVMVNGLSMENASSSFAIQTLKTCGKIANIVSVPRSGSAPCLSPPCCSCVWGGWWSWAKPCSSCSGCSTVLCSPAVPRVPLLGWDIAVGTWGRDSLIHHPFLLCFCLQTLKRQKKIHLPVSKSGPGSPAVHRRYDSDEDYGSRGADLALRSTRRHRSRDDLDHSRGYDGDSSSERSSGHHRDDRRQHKSVSRSRRRSQDSSHWRQSPDSGSDRRGYSRRRSANGFGHEGDTNGLALVSGFKRLPHQDVLMKPITSVLVKKKENEGRAFLTPPTLGHHLSSGHVPLGRRRLQGGCHGLAHSEGRCVSCWGHRARLASAQRVAELSSGACRCPVGAGVGLWGWWQEKTPAGPASARLQGCHGLSVVQSTA